MEVIIIHKLRLAGYLMYHGHNLIRMERSNASPGYNVFVFRDTAGLQESIDEYVNINKRHKLEA